MPSMDDPQALLRSMISESQRTLIFITVDPRHAARPHAQAPAGLEPDALSASFMRSVIDDALQALPRLETVVFAASAAHADTPPLLGAVAHAVAQGLRTRVAIAGSPPLSAGPAWFEAQDGPPDADPPGTDPAGPCRQLFQTLAITPQRSVAACSGRDFTSSADMRLGRHGVVPLPAFIDEIADDFLKLWIHVDGPREIARRLLGAGAPRSIERATHLCEACAALHADAGLRHAFQSRYREFMPGVLERHVTRHVADCAATGAPLAAPIRAALESLQPAPATARG